MTTRKADQESTGPAIQSLARGLQVLALLSRNENLGFLQIQRACGLSKGTTARILQTLECEGWVSKRMVDGHYRLGAHAPTEGTMAHAMGRLAELATEPLQTMHLETLWPSDIAVCDGSKMVFLDSNRGSGPITINRKIMSEYPRMLWSAVGRTYLGFCPASERKLILKNLSISDHLDDAHVANTNWVRNIVKETQTRGYGARVSDYPSPDQAYLGQLSAIAVPVRVGNHVIACLSLIWIRSMATEQQIVQSYITLLRKTADDIGKAFAEHAFDKPLWLDRRFSQAYL